MDLRGFLAFLETRKIREQMSYSNRWYNVKDFGAYGNGAAWDGPEINAALQAAKTGIHSIVFVPKGTYLIHEPLKIPSNVTLLLDNDAIIKRNATALDCMVINDSDGTVGGYDANTNIQIIGGTFDAGSYTTKCTMVAFGHCNDITIEGVTFKNLYDWHMLELNGVRDARVKNCNFENYGSRALGGAYGVGTEILQLDFFNSSTLFPWFGPYDNTDCKNILIENCNFVDGVRAIGSHSAVNNMSYSDVKIINCHFERMDEEAIKMLNYEDALVQGCSFKDCWKGIYISASYQSYEGYRILDNSFTDITYRDGLSARAITIAGVAGGNAPNKGIIDSNVLKNCGKHGIGIDYADNWVISNNIVEGAQQAGLWVYGGKRTMVAYNSFRNNNTSAMASRADICVGGAAAGQNETSKTNVIGNQCDTIHVMAQYVSLFSQNILSTVDGFTIGGHTGGFLKRRQNWIAGTWEESYDY